jgi:hypothetical protein
VRKGSGEEEKFVFIRVRRGKKGSKKKLETNEPFRQTNGGREGDYGGSVSRQASSRQTGERAERTSLISAEKKGVL